MKVALRIEVIDVIHTFRDLTITFAALWSKLARGGTDSVLHHHLVFIFFSWLYPDFKFSFFFKRPKEQLVTLIIKVFIVKMFFYSNFLRLIGCFDAPVLQLLFFKEIS